MQDAHDRYANIEVNYLLQRLESFEGCALLATNLMQGVDDAFLRRFDQVVHFPRPGVAERIAIWRAHLPAAHLADQVSIEQLGERFEHIILDIPAIHSTSDAIALASLTEACCVVIRQGITPMAQVRQAVDNLQHLNLLGVVFNQMHSDLPRWMHTLIPQE